MKGDPNNVECRYNIRRDVVCVCVDGIYLIQRDRSGFEQISG